MLYVEDTGFRIPPSAFCFVSSCACAVNRFVTFQVEQHEQLTGELENNYTELKNHCFEMQHAFFRAVEEYEEGFFGSMAQLAQVRR